MFRVRRIGIDTLSEHVAFVQESAVEAGALGFEPLDRIRIFGTDPDGHEREITAVLNFCRDSILAKDEIGVSEVAWRDLGLAEGSLVGASLARSPESVERVREKLAGRRLMRADFDAILHDVVERRYSKVELSMFVLACALRSLDQGELVDFTRAMIASGSCLDFGPGPVADKHCIGGVPGNRTTLVVVPVLAALGVRIPKTSSRAITSPSGTADTMAVLAEVALTTAQIHRVVERTGACIAWGGALDLAPADDVLITVERPMGIDTETQMVASILAKKKTAGATHALIDIPVGPTAKVRGHDQARWLAGLFEEVAVAIELDVDVVVTDAHGPIGSGVGPRLEALDALAVLRREKDAPADLREKSLFLAARLLERVGAVEGAEGYVAARRALDSGAAERKLEEILDAQGRRAIPEPAPFRWILESSGDGRIRAIDCWEIARIAKLAGAPAHAAAGLRLLRRIGDVTLRGEPLLEIHAQSQAQLDFAREHAERHKEIFQLGY